jgi:hypothetical protein
MGTLSRIAAAIFMVLFAGLLTAGERADANTNLASIANQASTNPTGMDEAWVGDYRVRDAHGERLMTIVRDATRVEYRVQNQPVRVWRQVPDGVELQELHPDRSERVIYAPGDLRARNNEPDWSQISSLIDPDLRNRLAEGRSGKAFGESLQRYRGRDSKNQNIELDWLIASAMPARYRVAAGHVDESRANETIELRGMRRLPAEQAFTPINGLRETDAADLGD